MRSSTLLIMCVLVSMVGGLVQGQGDDDIPPATFTPTTIDGGVLCEDEQLEFDITVNIPPIDIPPVNALDMVFLMDVTGSMSSEINSVKNSIGDIVSRLSVDVPDIRLGLATFADYPRYGGDPGDEPYVLQSDFSADVSQFQTNLEPVRASGGGDGPESLYRGLWEVGQLDWRPDALRIVIVFTDAPPVDPDPGRDGERGTDDDLDEETVLSILDDNSVQVIAVQSGSNARTRRTLVNIANDTNGTHIELNDAADIPELVVGGVSGLVSRSRFSFDASGDGLDTESADSRWFRQSPRQFRYAVEGVNQTVTITIDPTALNGGDGEYNLNLNLTRQGDSFGMVPVQFEYYALCSDFVIPDTEDDDGTACSTGTFWESPSITISYDADGAGQSLHPRPGVPNFVFVTVQMTGARSAIGTVEMFASDTALTAIFPQGWVSLGEIAQEMQPDTTLTYGPYEWTPTSDTTALRAIVSNPNDPIDTSTADIACENNVAALHRTPTTLDIPTFGTADQMGGVLALEYRGIEPQLRFDTAELDGRVQIEGEDVTSGTWTAPASSGVAPVLITSTAAENARLPVALADPDAGESGITIYYTTASTSLGTPPDQADTSSLPPELVLAGLAFVAVGTLLVIGFAVINRPASA